jgi:ABC-type multidrug transport system fused ATPase/permease subunit
MIVVEFILFMILSYMLSGVVHELGHIVVGMINGWKFLLLVVGPIGLKRNEQDKVVMYLEKNPVLWGGVGGTIPLKHDERNLKIWKSVLLAGPLASILMGAIFLPMALLAESKNLLLIFLGAMPLGMGLMTILPLPMKTGILYSDGYRYKRLSSQGQAYLEEKALFNITQLQVTESFSEVDYQDIENLSNSTEPSIKYYGLYYSFKYYELENDKVKMKYYSEQMLKNKDGVSQIIIQDCKID